MVLPFDSVAIVGVGLLGGSIGMALRAGGWEGRRIGVGRRPEALAEAREFGAIDEAMDDLAQVGSEADLVILATPVRAFEPLLTRLAPTLKETAIVTDVGSTKAHIVTQAEAIVGPHRFVGSHPMAGTEQKGVAFARADLFEGARCILTPTARTEPLVIDTVQAFWKALGMRVLQMTPDAHDEAVARVSHLPQILSSLLMALPDDDDLSVAANGFRDSTRLAGGDPEMWRDILLTNAGPIIAAIESMKLSLKGLKELVEAGDAEGIEALLTAARDRRRDTVARQHADHRVSAE